MEEKRWNTKRKDGGRKRGNHLFFSRTCMKKTKLLIIYFMLLVGGIVMASDNSFNWVRSVSSTTTADTNLTTYLNNSIGDYLDLTTYSNGTSDSITYLQGDNINISNINSSHSYINVTKNLTVNDIIINGANNEADELMGYANVHLTNLLSGRINLEYYLNPVNNMWSIDNGGNNLRFFTDGTVYGRVNKSGYRTTYDYCIENDKCLSNSRQENDLNLVVTYSNLLAEDVLYFYEAFIVSTGTATPTGFQPDYSRVLLMECSADPLNTMNIIFTVNGTDTDNSFVSEGWAITGSAGGMYRYTTNNSYIEIDSVHVDSVSTGSHVCSIGYGDILGLPNFPFDSVDDVYKVVDNNKPYTNYVVNTEYGWVNVTGALNTNDEFTFYYTI